VDRFKGRARVVKGIERQLPATLAALDLATTTTTTCTLTFPNIADVAIDVPVAPSHDWLAACFNTWTAEAWWPEVSSGQEFGIGWGVVLVLKVASRRIRLCPFAFCFLLPVPSPCFSFAFASYSFSMLAEVGSSQPIINFVEPYCCFPPHGCLYKGRG